MEKILSSMLLLALLLFAVVMPAQAVDNWHTANQATLQWNAVTTNINGDTVTDAVEYVVYMANAVTDPNKTNAVEVWRGTETQALLTLNTEGQYFVGVKAVRKLADGEAVAQSEVAWSDNPLCVEGEVTFGLRYYLPLMAPGGLRP